MTKKYAQPIKKLTKYEYEIAIEVVKRFVRNTFVRNTEYEITLDKFHLPPYTYSATVVKRAGRLINERCVDLVRCPNCHAIQACWGQFGDPATENTLCTKCNELYEVEPF